MCPTNFEFGPRTQNVIHARHTPTDLRRQSVQGSEAMDSTSDESWCDSLLGQKIDLVCIASGPALGPPSFPFNGHRGSFLGGKTIGAWNWPLTPSGTEFENEKSYNISPRVHSDNLISVYLSLLSTCFAWNSKRKCCSITHRCNSSNSETHSRSIKKSQFLPTEKLRPYYKHQLYNYLERNSRCWIA
jgi:hypothetical protein